MAEEGTLHLVQDLVFGIVRYRQVWDYVRKGSIIGFMIRPLFYKRLDNSYE